MSNRAVSDVLGYVLIFGVLISTVFLLYGPGFGSIKDVQENEKRRNAEKAFSVLQDNIEDLVDRTASFRSTGISLGDSQIYFGEPTTIRYNVSYPTNNTSLTIQTEPIVYRTKQEQKVVYVNGYLLRKTSPESNGYIFDSNNVNFSKENIILPLLVTVNEEAVESNGGGVVRLSTTRRQSQSFFYRGKGPYTFNMIINNTNYPHAWGVFCKEKAGVELQSRDNNTVTCSSTRSYNSILIHYNKIGISILN